MINRFLIWWTDRLIDIAERIYPLEKNEYTLEEKQRIFTKQIAKLISFAYDQGYELTFAEAYRTKEQAEWNAKRGKGIVKSLHRDRLAVDFNLFKDGKWLQNSEDHASLGKFWESLSTPGLQHCWGGRFGDGNHYSISHGGVK